MNVSKPLVEQILKTLPIGYYCGRDIDVELSDSDTTCINLVEDKIQISYPTISDVAKTLANDSNIENDIRCLLYHEVSHAILTPKSLRTEMALKARETSFPAPPKYSMATIAAKNNRKIRPWPIPSFFPFNFCVRIGMPPRISPIKNKLVCTGTLAYMALMK